MADAPIAHIGENSPEEVAYKLMQRIFSAENRSASGSQDRKYILSTYVECVKAVKYEVLSG